jgi:hypothetical protein
MGDDILDCTKAIIIDIPIFKKHFLSKRRRAVVRGRPESGTFDAQGIAAGKPPIGRLRLAPDSKSPSESALSLWSLAIAVQRDRCPEDRVRHIEDLASGSNSTNP